ncbi:response regulator [Actinomycetospora straminea]|uniref:LuxR family two component transcriptional regulator n=1 Tax=Actinomycetospora straminea TaxID=663607 RepID=A0ABP9ERW9_9PSEU
MGTTPPIRVVLADDHPVVRRGLAALLDSVDGIAVVGQAATGREAVREAQLLAPDVVLMDVQMPDLDGVEASRRIAATSPGVAVLVLTMHDDDETVLAALRAGARGYLLKGADQEEIRRAVHAVVAGEMIVAPAAAAHVVARLAAPPPAAPFPELTPRERDVLDAMARGRRNHAIAEELGLAAKTVGNHVSAILAKLGVETRAEAVAGAIGEVRRLVHDLRPPVLDQLGLVAAVRQQAERVAHDDGPTVTVEADAVGTLPAAVEVAAYRVVSEAVLNVVRHAGARHATVAVRREPGALELLVVDDGDPGAPWTPGVGLTSMRERLAQLGGTLEAGATPDGGRVRARLPLAT